VRIGALSLATAGEPPLRETWICRESKAEVSDEFQSGSALKVLCGALCRSTIPCELPELAEVILRVLHPIALCVQRFLVDDCHLQVKPLCALACHAKAYHSCYDNPGEDRSGLFAFKFALEPVAIASDDQRKCGQKAHVLGST